VEVTANVVEGARVEIDEHLALVEATVNDVHRRWREFVDKDDLMQEAYVWWYGPGQPYLAEYLEDLAKTRLRRSIWRHVAAYADREKRAVAPVNPDHQTYRAREVAALLPIALDPDALPLVGVHDGGPAAKGNLAEGGNVLASLLDVRIALRTMTEDELHFLHLCADLRNDWDRIGHHTGTEPNSAYRRHTRIAIRLTRYLNGQEINS
jgi:hypothetical protein